MEVQEVSVVDGVVEDVVDDFTGKEEVVVVDVVVVVLTVVVVLSVVVVVEVFKLGKPKIS